MSSVLTRLTEALADRYHVTGVELQIIYAVEPGSVPLFVGQQMDVFIEAAPDGSG